MNILYINHYAGSPEMGMEFRPYYLAREWVRMGHKVSIIAGDYSHLRMSNPDILFDFQEQDIDGITYIWIRTGKYEGNGSARAFTMFRFVRKLMRNAKKLSEMWKPDVVIASSTYPLDTYAAQRIAKFARAKLIHEVHDMWPITLIELGGMKKTHPFVMLMQMAENSFCRNSDYIVSLPCAAKEYFIRHGMEQGKFKAILNGVVLEEWGSSQALPGGHQELLDQLHGKGKFVICFFGSITKSYAIDYLLEASKILNNKSIVIVLVGDGNQKAELIDKASGRQDVYFLDKIPKAAIPTLMNNIDCCYVGALHNNMFRYGICMNKLFDSMMSGKPILYAVEAPNNFIEEYSCGISVRAEDAEALADGIDRMVHMDSELRKILGQNGKKAVMEHFNYQVLAEQFIELFQ